MTSFSGSVSQVRANWQEGAMYNARQKMHACTVILYGTAKILCLGSTAGTRGLKRDVVYLGWTIALSYMSPNGGRRGVGYGVSANEYSYAHGTQINFLRSNSIFNLWLGHKDFEWMSCISLLNLWFTNLLYSTFRITCIEVHRFPSADIIKFSGMMNK